MLVLILRIHQGLVLPAASSEAAAHVLFVVGSGSCGQGLAWLEIIPSASRVLCACYPIVHHELQGELLSHFPLLSEKIQNLFLRFYVFII